MTMDYYTPPDREFLHAETRFATNINGGIDIRVIVHQYPWSTCGIDVGLIQDLDRAQVPFAKNSSVMLVCVDGITQEAYETPGKVLYPNNNKEQ